MIGNGNNVIAVLRGTTPGDRRIDSTWRVYRIHTDAEVGR